MAVLLLDLDETLVDRAQVIREWAVDAATITSGDTDDELVNWIVDWDCTDHGIRARDEFLDGVRKRLGWTESVDELLERWPTEFGGRYRLDQHTRSALQFARGASVPTVIVTNGQTARQRAKLVAMDLHDLVDGWVISEEVGVRKPDRRIFEIAAESVGAPLQGSWVVGDDPVLDIGAAIDAGLNCVWVNRHHRRWEQAYARPHSFLHPAPAIRHAANAMSTYPGC